MIMRESLVLVLIGVVIGVGSALAAGRLVASLLFGLAPTDASIIAVAALVMIVVSRSMRPSCVWRAIFT